MMAVKWERSHNRKAMASSRNFDCWTARVGIFKLHVLTHDGQKWQFEGCVESLPGAYAFKEAAMEAAERQLSNVLQLALAQLEAAHSGEGEK